MEKNASKRKPLRFALLLFLCLLISGFFSASILLSKYIEKKIFPGLGRQVSAKLAGRAYYIGLTSAAFGDISLGSDQDIAVSIGSIHADYSLFSLLGKRIKRLNINGLTIHVELTEDGFRVPGLVLPETASLRAGPENADLATVMSLPIDVEKLQLRNCLIDLRHNGRHFLLPFELQLAKTVSGRQPPVYTLSLPLLPQGDEINLSGTIEPGANRATVNVRAAALDFSKFAFLIGKRGEDPGFGDLSIKADAVISLLPFQIRSANIVISPAAPFWGKTTVQITQQAPAQDLPLLCMEPGTECEQWQVKMQSIITKPQQAALDLSGSVYRSEEKLQGTGTISARFIEPLGDVKLSQSKISFRKNPEINSDFSFLLHRSGTWQFLFNSPGNSLQPGVSMHYNNALLLTGNPSMVLKGQGILLEGETDLSLRVPRIRVEHEGLEVTIPELNLQASYKLAKDRDENNLSSGQVFLKLPNTGFKKSDLGGSGDFSLRATLPPQPVAKLKTVQAQGQLLIANAELQEASSRVHLQSMEATIPWYWPPSDREKKGTIKVPSIEWQNKETGSLLAEISLREKLYSLEGNFSSSLLKGFGFKISGQGGIKDAGYFGGLTLHSAITPFATVNLGVFHPAMQKSFLSGKLGLDGTFRVDTSGMKGRLLVKMQEGLFEFPEKKYAIHGIAFSMLMPSLPVIRTASAQTLSFAEASLGNLFFSNGKLVWQVESQESLLLEEGVVHWAGGRVFTNAVRFTPDLQKFVMPVFCDRLKLTELLQQLGITEAVGEGTVNGRIPLHVYEGSVSFEDGFLYSSPGQGGSIRVAALDLLSAGIPKDTPQFAQVDFAAEALKDFQYNWVKLLLNSEGEDLVMKMQMDGKPVQSLPFTYDSSTGTLKRTEDNRPGIQQPIRLDVNFRFPLNRFLGYSGKIKDIMDKIQ